MQGGENYSLDSVGGGELVTGVLATHELKEAKAGEKEECEASRLEATGGSPARSAAHTGKGLRPPAVWREVAVDHGQALLSQPRAVASHSPPMQPLKPLRGTGRSAWRAHPHGAPTGRSFG